MQQATALPDAGASFRQSANKLLFSLSCRLGAVSAVVWSLQQSIPAPRESMSEDIRESMETVDSLALAVSDLLDLVRQDADRLQTQFE